MPSRLILRLPLNPDGDTDAPVNWLEGDDHATNRVTTGTLEEFSQKLRDDNLANHPKVTVLLPASEVLLVQAIAPAVSKKQLQQLIPFAVEDLLIESVEKQHFSLGQKNQQQNQKQADGQIRQTVAVIQQDRMQQRLAQLQQYGIPSDIILSEAQCLPCNAQEWTVLLEEDRPALLRYDQSSVHPVESDCLIGSLTLILASFKESMPDKIVVHDFTGSNSDDSPHRLKHELEAILADQNIDCEWHLHDGHPLSLLGSEMALENSINLRQGAFSRQQQLSRLWKPWRLSAALAAMLLIIVPIALKVEYQQNQQTLQILNQRITATFKGTFPDAKKIVNARVQMENRLNAMKKTQGTSDDEFLRLLSTAASTLGNSPNIRLENMRFKTGKLTLSLKIESFELLDSLKKELTATGLAVNIQSATSNNDTVKAQINLSSGTST